MNGNNIATVVELNSALPGAAPVATDDTENEDIDEVIFYQLRPGTSKRACPPSTARTTSTCHHPTRTGSCGPTSTPRTTTRARTPSTAVARSTRYYHADAMVDLAVFPDTEVDGSTLPTAVIINPATGDPAEP